MFNLIKKAAAGTHKIQQESSTVLEDFSEEFEKQLTKAKEAERNHPPEDERKRLEEEEQAEERQLDELKIEDLRQEKRKLLQEIKELEHEAEAIMAHANNTAKDIELDAKKKGKSEGFEKGYEEGAEQGYKEALEEGLRQIKQENEGALQELKNIIVGAEAEKEELIKKHQDDLKDIAIAVAEKVVHVSLKSSGDIIKRMILSATEGMTDLKWAKIYIAESDSHTLVKGDGRLIDEISQLSSSIKVIVMPDEEPGTCIIELPDKVLDASARTQIENIRDIISSARR